MSPMPEPRTGLTNTIYRVARAAWRPGARVLQRRLPEPLQPAPRWDGAIVWDGGVHVMGPLLVIPGRALDVEHLDEAEHHALSVLAAVEVLRGT